jgi:TPR repeat protein
MVVGTALLAGCAHRQHKPDDPAPLPDVVAQDFDIPKREREHLAEIGHSNSFAAFRLYEYYQIAHYDRSNAMYWLYQSANQGNPKAECSLGKFETFLPGYIDPVGARQWFKLAAAQGDPDAIAELKKMDAEGK